MVKIYLKYCKVLWRSFSVISLKHTDVILLRIFNKYFMKDPNKM